jgi:predicted cobalt transporter CbtA
MVGSLLMRGMLVGLLAGILCFGFAKLFGEPQIDRAIAVEERLDQAKGEPPEAEIFSRQTQSTIGLLTGVVVYSTSFGGLFGLVFAAAAGRIGRIGPRGLAALLALLGFVAVNFVPELKYPASPPSVGHAETIRYRTEMYLVMLLASIAAMVLAVNLCQISLRRLGLWNAVLLGGGAYVVAIVIAQSLLPEINEVPDSFPAVVLWRFRVASLGTQFLMWATLGIVFGWLVERRQRRGYEFA